MRPEPRVLLALALRAEGLAWSVAVEDLKLLWKGITKSRGESIDAFTSLLSCFFGGATGAVLKSEAAVDGNRKEVADRVASLQAHLAR